MAHFAPYPQKCFLLLFPLLAVFVNHRGTFVDPELSLGNDRGVVPQPVAGLWLKLRLLTSALRKVERE